MSDYEEDIMIDEDFAEALDDAVEYDEGEDIESEFEDYETFDPVENTNLKIRNNFLNIYEITMLVGYRATQISNGARTFLPDENEAKRLCNPLLIAEEEFKRGLIPFDIIRHLNIGKNIKNVCLNIGDNGLQILDVGNMF